MDMIKKIKGFADLLPPVSNAYAFMEQTATRVFSLYGYDELRLPVLERTELFARGIGEETDVVQKEMYTFPDRKGRSLTLRPEATAGAVRAYIENKLYADAGSVTKLYAYGPMFRYERPQKGRMRQFHQIDVEAFGSSAAILDAEVILMLGHFLTEIGLNKLSFEINSLGCRECRPVYLKTLADFLATLPEDELCEDCRRRKSSNPLRVLDCKVPRCKELTENAPQLSEHCCPDCKDHFAAVLDPVNAAGLTYTINPRLVRGLDYYTRTTFEVVSGDIGSQSSVAGGGRYDGLISALDGPDLPGVGFACGMERLALLLAERIPPKPDFFFVVLDGTGLSTSLELAQSLRRAGLSGVTALEAKSAKSQFRQADKANARFCLILGQSECESRTVTVKNMENGQQETIPMADLADYMNAR
ncbi:histidine--tRNA ligase [Desulfovibrio inopinatus]|uniref:histidine--tRNA ligase n=1 Tax=Desulfovibrio inopinatus TaxID=102109 RepID=UPI0004803D4B|nr:histidine--tRNA ligase [Desulfovibrio inopinatus]